MMVREKLGATLLLLLLCIPGAAMADAAADDAAEIAALRAQMEQFAQRLQQLEQRQQQREAAASPPVASAPAATVAGDERKGQATVHADEEGLWFGSADGGTQVRFRGLLSFDLRSFDNSLAPNGTPVPAGSDGFLIRQARVFVNVNLGNFAEVKIVPDFSQGRTTLLDADMEFSLRPWLHLTMGKFKVPVGLERQQGDGDTRFIDRGLPDRLIPGRDIGLQLSGELLDGRLSYQAAWMNGVLDGANSDANQIPDQDNDNQRDLALRVFALPFVKRQDSVLHGLGVGLGGSVAHQHGTVDASGAATNSLLTDLRSNGRLTFFSWRGGTTPTIAWGERVRLVPQAYYYSGPIGLMAEYALLRQDVRRTIGSLTRDAKLDQTAWQLAAAWSVTGEPRGFGDGAPRHPFQVGGPGWGSFDVMARVAELDVDAGAFTGGVNSFADPASSAHRAHAWTLGVNWGLTRNAKLLVDYERTVYSGGAPQGGNAPSEGLLTTRFRLKY